MSFNNNNKKKKKRLKSIDLCHRVPAFYVNSSLRTIYTKKPRRFSSPTSASKNKLSIAMVSGTPPEPSGTTPTSPRADAGVDSPVTTVGTSERAQGFDTHGVTPPLLPPTSTPTKTASELMTPRSNPRSSKSPRRSLNREEGAPGDCHKDKKRSVSQEPVALTSSSSESETMSPRSSRPASPPPAQKPSEMSPLFSPTTSAPRSLKRAFDEVHDAEQMEPKRARSDGWSAPSSPDDKNSTSSDISRSTSSTAIEDENPANTPANNVKSIEKEPSAVTTTDSTKEEVAAEIATHDFEAAAKKSALIQSIEEQISKRPYKHPDPVPEVVEMKKSKSYEMGPGNHGVEFLDDAEGATTSPGKVADLRDEIAMAAKVAANELQKLSHTIPIDLKQFEHVKAKGLHNSGVMCYRNTAIQLLMHNYKFVAWIQNEHPADQCASGKEAGACITCNLRNFTELYWSPDKNGRTLDLLMEDLENICDDLEYNCGGANGQGDPEDLWRWMLNRMDSEVSPAARKSLASISTIVLTSTMECKLCGDQATKPNVYEGLLTLCLNPVPQKFEGKHWFRQYLQRYFQGDEIQGHRCDKCKQVSNKYRKYEMVHAPDVITFQLGRFDSNQKKIHTEITYHSNLDMSRWNINQARPAKYKLSGVINHHGKRLDHGHYTAYVKNPATKQWYFVNDTAVRPVDEGNALDPKKDMAGNLPYILTYVREPNA